jgi:hypothetical protein
MNNGKKITKKYVFLLKLPEAIVKAFTITSERYLVKKPM